jgi:hypothetical protein
LYPRQHFFNGRLLGFPAGLEFHVDTFRGHFKLARLGNDHLLLGLVAGERLGLLDFLDDVETLEDLAENDVPAIEPPAK